jgi:hypothetical protein
MPCDPKERMKALLQQVADKCGYKVHALQVTSVNVILIMDGEQPGLKMAEVLGQFCDRVKCFATFRDATTTEKRNGLRRQVRAWHVSGWLKG